MEEKRRKKWRWMRRNSNKFDGFNRNPLEMVDITRNRVNGKKKKEKKRTKKEEKREEWRKI